MKGLLCWLACMLCASALGAEVEENLFAVENEFTIEVLSSEIEQPRPRVPS